MALIHLIQRASLLAGMTIASIPLCITPARAEQESCIIASNGKTVCGTPRSIELMCVTTDGNNICGKFKGVGAAQAQVPARTSATLSGFRKEVNGTVLTLRNCTRSGSNLKCRFLITTKKKVNYFSLYTGEGYSSIVDSAGITYPSYALEYNASTDPTFRKQLLLGIDYIVDINFENIPAQITKAALLNISTDKPVQFRNVPISN